MLWEATYSQNNTICNKEYASWMKSVLTNSAAGTKIDLSCMAPPAPISTSGSCGGTGGMTCAGSTFGNCCSANGWCGSAAAYCGQGCQSAFGNCTSTSSTSSTTSTATSSTATSTSSGTATTTGTSTSTSSGTPTGTTTPSKPVSNDGSCAGTKGFSCLGSAFGSCCSQSGWWYVQSSDFADVLQVLTNLKRISCSLLRRRVPGRLRKLYRYWHRHDDDGGWRNDLDRKACVKRRVMRRREGIHLRRLRLRQLLLQEWLVVGYTFAQLNRFPVILTAFMYSGASAAYCGAGCQTGFGTGCT